MRRETEQTSPKVRVGAVRKSKEERRDEWALRECSQELARSETALLEVARLIDEAWSALEYSDDKKENPAFGECTYTICLIGWVATDGFLLGFQLVHSFLEKPTKASAVQGKHPTN